MILPLSVFMKALPPSDFKPRARAIARLGQYRLSDVIEFMAAGARAVAFGTINYVDPMALPVALAKLTAYLAENGIDDVNSLVGLAHQQEAAPARSPTHERIVA